MRDASGRFVAPVWVTDQSAIVAEIRAALISNRVHLLPGPRSQSELARLVGVSPAAVSSWFAGRKKIAVSTADMLIVAAKCA